MRGQTARALFTLTVVLLGFIVAGCEKGYRQVVVVDGDKTEFVTFGPAPKDANQDAWAPKRVVVFRSDSTVPGAPQTAKASGKAGRVYRVNTDAQELEEVSEFDLSIPNDTLAYRYGR